MDQPVAPQTYGIINGEACTKLPDNLYIPPHALTVLLETFEGPLDLLLYLIRHQNIDILNIPIFQITRQYMSYVELMKELHFELAAEYLLMAAMLAEIKSRLLLPQPKFEEEESEDPRAELVRRLQVYEQFKKASEDLNALPRLGRDTFNTQVDLPELDVVRRYEDVTLLALLSSLSDVLKRTELSKAHHIQREELSVRERMSQLLLSLENQDKYLPISALFYVEQGKLGIVVTFLAVLELIKLSFVDLTQAEPFSEIYLKRRMNNSAS
jgi:segregation and condensation protein A